MGTGPVHAFVLTHLLSSLKQQEHLKYVLSLIDEIFEDFPAEHKTTRLGHFLGLHSENESFPMAPFLALLDMQDSYLQYLAAQLSGTLLFAREESQDMDKEKDADLLLRWILATIKKSDSTDTRRDRAAIKCLQRVLQKDSMRVKFSEMGGVGPLANILNDQFKAVMENKTMDSDQQQPSNRDLQLVYEALFCCWLLSYNPVVAENDFTGTTIILNCVRLLREVDKEKVRRVGLAMLRNLSGKAEYDEAMIHAGFWKLIVQFSVKRWGDEDIVNDVHFLLERMESKMIDMTTFDRYKQELLSGQLEWSPAHKSEKFWKENYTRFNEKDYELVGILGALLKADEPQTAAIACHDLGEFSRFHPNGRKIIHERQIKTQIMSMIDAEDLLVQQQALLALQKLMVSNWQHVTQK